MKRLKKTILILLCVLTSAFILLILIGIFAGSQENIEDRVLENVKIDYGFEILDDHMRDDYKIMTIMEVDTILNPSPGRIVYSADKTTVRELMNAVIPSKDFIWRTEGNVIHIIAKSLDKRADYQLNVEIPQFSETGNYADMIEMALGQINHRNFPEKIIPSMFANAFSDIKNNLCPFRIKAHNITLRQLLDRIVLETKGEIHYYSVRRARERDGSVILWVDIREERITGFSSAEPKPPCPKI